MSRKIEVWEVAISIFLVTGFLMADGQADIEGNTDQLRLRAELQRLESELKRISNPEQLEVEENFQQQKDTPARVREIQQRIGKIQGIQSQPGRKVSVPTKEQLDKIIANLRVEINKANKPIEKVAELAPGSEELRMLRRRLSHKKRVLHWRISQRNWLETQEEKKLQQLDPEGEKTSPSSEQIEVVLDELSIDPTEFNQSEDTSFHNRQQLEFFSLNYVSADYALDVVEPFLTPGNIAVSVDLNTNTLIVRDVPKVLIDIDQIIAHIDINTDKQNKRQIPDD
ncbi:TPA: hypothetical protein EYN98_12295 [Candidatus Poribacteria bacterium]|nr:hypothetical protein [Candidatus Poribacteria bacterium]HIC00537.1 hypothetical protein [Candidatus Poribacteria bacterium]